LLMVTAMKNKLDPDDAAKLEFSKFKQLFEVNKQAHTTQTQTNKHANRQTPTHIHTLVHIQT